MKILGRILTVVVSVLATVGCSVEKEFGDDSFEESVVLSREVRNIESTFTPDDMWVVRDSLIVVSNKGNLDSMFMVIDGSDWSLKHVFASRSKGFVKPFIVRNSDVVMIYDQINNRIATLSSRGELSDKRRGLTESDIPSDISCYKSTFIYQDSPFNAAGTIVKLENHQRSVIRDFTPQLRRCRTPYGYFGTMGLRPDGERFVYAYQYSRRFDICMADGKVLSVNQDTNSPFIATKEGGGVDRINSNIYYDGVSVSMDRIYLYYIGQSETELKGANNVATFVEEFDWDGNPLKRYQLEGVYDAVSYVRGAFVGISEDRSSQFDIYDIE